MNTTTASNQGVILTEANRIAHIAAGYHRTATDLAATLGGPTSATYYAAKAFSEVYARANRVLRDHAAVIDDAWMTGYIEATTGQAAMYLGDVAEYTEKGFPRASVARVRAYAQAYGTLVPYLSTLRARIA